MTDKQIIISIAVMAAVTAAIRFLPFIVFFGRKTPAAVTYLGKVLPCAVMGMLVVYCLKDVGFASVKNFLPQLISVALVAGSYVWKRNTLFSIVSGTLCYMVLVQFIFK